MGKKFVLDQEDGTATNGNLRGDFAVDLQMSRYNNGQVASGANSFVGGGSSNRASGAASVCVGGENNFSTGQRGFVGCGVLVTAGGLDSVCVGGSSNTAAANYSIISGGASNIIPTNAASFGTISGGQSNTVSSNTHATIVGGQGNVSSGQHSVAGGLTNTASGSRTTAFGTSNIVNGQESLASGLQNTVSGSRSFATGYSNNVGGGHNIAVGWGNTITGGMSGVIGTGCSAGGNSSFANGDGSQANGAQSLAQGYASYTGTANSSAFGLGGFTALTNQQALGNRLNYIGDSQTSKVVYSIATGLVSSGGTYTFTGNELIIPKNLSYGSGVTQAYLCTAKFIYSTRAKTGTVNTINAKDCFTAIYNFAAKSTLGFGSALIGTPALQTSFSDTNLTATVIAITIGGSGEILFSFTPPMWTGGGTIEFRGTLSLEFTEIGVYQ